MKKLFNLIGLFALVILTACKSIPTSAHKQYSQFIGLKDFSTFAQTENENGETVLLSPRSKPAPCGTSSCFRGISTLRPEPS